MLYDVTASKAAKNYCSCVFLFQVQVGPTENGDRDVHISQQCVGESYGCKA